MCLLTVTFWGFGGGLWCWLLFHIFFEKRELFTLDDYHIFDGYSFNLASSCSVYNEHSYELVIPTRRSNGWIGSVSMVGRWTFGNKDRVAQ
jgi:hypothetical protein